jgi:hypothetical protein
MFFRLKNKRNFSLITSRPKIVSSIKKQTYKKIYTRSRNIISINNGSRPF